ncbi:hypothetical protein GCM10027592_45910 [Spirosoma flavus]
MCPIDWQNNPSLQYRSGSVQTGGVSYQQKKKPVEEKKLQEKVDQAVKVATIVDSLWKVDRHWNLSKKAMVKLDEITESISRMPSRMVGSLEGIKHSLDEGLTNLSLGSLRETIADTPGQIEIKAWVKPIEQLGIEATQQISVIQGMIAEFRFEETSLTKTLDLLRDKLLRAIDALVGFVNKCESKIRELITSLGQTIGGVSRKWSQTLNNMPRLNRLLARASDAIGSFFKIISKRLPLIGNTVDLWGANEARDAYKENAKDADIKRKYVVSLLGFIVGVVITLLGIFLGPLLGILAVILGGCYAALSLILGEDPIAAALYAVDPETMAKLIDKVESLLSWIQTLPAVISGWVEKVQAKFDEWILSARDMALDTARMIGETKDAFVNSQTGQRLGDFLYENLP